MPVYFVRAGDNGPVKIGHAGEVADRLRELQCAHYERLSVVREIDGGRIRESWLHKHFAALRIRNEWFLFSPEMLSIEVPAESEIATPKTIGADAAAVIKAADAAGGQTALAIKLGTSSQQIWNWINRDGGAPAEWILRIEQATGVPRYELRPDIYPPEEYRGRAA